MSNGSPLPHLAGIWFVLILLLAASIAIAHLSLGAFNVLLALVIAAAQAALLLFFFMGMRTGNATLRLVVSTGIVWLLLLVTLTLADLLTRDAIPSPWQ